MNKKARNKMALIEAIAEKDPRYKRMMLRYNALEARFDRMIARLPDKYRDLAWDYVMYSTHMDRYMLRMACIHMEFPTLSDELLDFSDDYSQRCEEAQALAETLPHKHIL